MNLRAIRRLFWSIIIVGAFACMMTPAVHGQCVGVCGDVNGDGSLNTADVIALSYYTNTATWLTGDPLCADVDGDPGITIRDLSVLVDKVFWNTASPDCEPDGSPYVPLPNSGYRLRHNLLSVRTLAPRMMLHIELTVPNPTMAISIPLLVLVDGVPAAFGIIDSTAQQGGDFDNFNFGDERSANVPPGHIMGGFVDYEPGYTTGRLWLGSVELLNPPQFTPHIITVVPVEIPSGNNTPMAVQGITREGWAINVETCIVCRPGDISNDGVVTSADVITMVNSIFKCGICYPYPVFAAGDMNCDGTRNSTDIIALVNYVFKGGAPPCDVENVCTILSTDPAGAWICP